MTMWSEERTAKLRTLRAEGLTCGEIAEVLGMTRSAIGGKLARERRRSGISIDEAALTARIRVRLADGQQRRRSRNPAPPTPPKPPKPPKLLRYSSNERPVNMRDLAYTDDDLAAQGVPFALLREHSCRWPIRPDSSQFCGAPRENDRLAYCEHHNMRAYRLPRR